MKNSKTLKITIISLVVISILVIGAYAAGILGTQNDPLVTLSYLNQKHGPKLMDDLSGEMDAKAKALEKEFDKALAEAGIADNDFKEITLTSGDLMTLSAGSQVIVRSGNNYLMSDFMNSTSGKLESKEALVLANNLYIAPKDGSSIYSEGEGKIIVRGSFEVNNYIEQEGGEQTPPENDDPNDGEEDPETLEIKVPEDISA
ncbi:hypothetical protein LJC01_01205 [Clostridiaceae bacterium OttesenSCG-928-D20]|nr:hypothetical protein [Clostridiaceae bacterium OttesenSCG-928-D20]